MGESIGSAEHGRGSEDGDPQHSAAAVMTDVSKLPEDLLRMILDKLHMKDLFRCTAVCQHWCEAVFQVCRNFNGQRQEIPWYTMNPYFDDAMIHFFSPWEAQQAMISYSFSRIQNAYIIGSYYGWLIITNQVEVQLINLISRVCIDLPSIPFNPRMRWSFTGRLSSAPSHNRDHAVILICRGFQLDSKNCILFANATDERWTEIYTGQVYIGDAIFHRGKLYAAVTLEGGVETVVVYDVIAPHSMTQLGGFLNTLDLTLQVLFVSVPSGDLWLVQEFENNFKLWKVNAEQSLIVPANSLGTYTLFLGCTSSFCINSLSFPELKSDAIYFFDILCIWIHSLKDGNRNSLTSYRQFLENLAPLDIWFTPIPAQADLI